MLRYIVTNKPYLYVRSQMTTKNSANVKRKMSNGEGFIVYQTYVQNGSELWGRISSNPGLVEQEYACLQIGNRQFAKADDDQPLLGNQPNVAWFVQMDAWARSMGYKGVFPF